MKQIDPRFFRYREAYLAMSGQAGYRPAAPSDGFGHIQLSADQLNDAARLSREADYYAVGFVHEDDAMSYPIGCPDYTFNRAFCWAIEAARLLCSPAPVEAHKLLLMAAAINTEIRKEAGSFRSREWQQRLKVLNGKRSNRRERSKG
jgi:hypothetical protein